MMARKALLAALGATAVVTAEVRGTAAAVFVPAPVAAAATVARVTLAEVLAATDVIARAKPHPSPSWASLPAGGRPAPSLAEVRTSYGVVSRATLHPSPTVAGPPDAASPPTWAAAAPVEADLVAIGSTTGPPASKGAPAGQVQPCAGYGHPPAARAVAAAPAAQLVLPLHTNGEVVTVTPAQDYYEQPYFLVVAAPPAHPATAATGTTNAGAHRSLPRVAQVGKVLG
ncbi:hypothetical protein I4F81_005876 [Pyropia yezoensis]|uniref:Uncharacterized protein n=1 Tax=Pyropia yezoensis TaxID=2788 RepID=A0ACC3BZN1_PYRYE|nr:hypothetical protein I4F81_005876 [Neopyropia yezoensis]